MRKERVAHPHGVVAGWAVWDLSGLGVHGDHGAWSLANVASRDVSADVSSLNGHHWNWSVSGQPVRLSVSASVSADFVGTAEGGWESAELSRARASATQVLGVVVVVTNGVEKGVARPKWKGAGWAAWVLIGLGVSGEDNTDSLWTSLVTWHAWVTVKTVGAWKAWEASWTSWTLWTATADLSGGAWWTRDTWNTSWAGWTLGTWKTSLTAFAVLTVLAGWTSLAFVTLWCFAAAAWALWTSGAAWTSWTLLAVLTVLTGWTLWTSWTSSAWSTWLTSDTARASLTLWTILAVDTVLAVWASLTGWTEWTLLTVEASIACSTGKAVLSWSTGVAG